MNNQDQDSDDDTQVYFLKPVNQYNIAQKIKEANEKLFSDETVYDEKDTKLFCSSNQQNRKVTFALNLVQFEPNFNDANKDDSNDKLQEKEVDLDAGKDLSDFLKEKMANTMSTEILKMIKEEELLITETDAMDHSKKRKEQQSPLITKEIKINDAIQQGEPDAISSKETLILDIQNLGKCNDGAGDGYVLLDMKTTNGTEETVGEKDCVLAITKKEESDMKANNDIGDKCEPDNKILPIDETKKENIDNNKYTEIDINKKNHIKGNEKPTKLRIKVDEKDMIQRLNDNDDADDDISLIPAAYMPNDNINSLKKDRIRNMTTYELCPKKNDIIFHYRSCCDYKRAHFKLPKYTGYLSEYGMSLEQKRQRKEKILEKQACLLRCKLLSTELEMQKMHDNERAFTKWLKNKMRYPINKVRNMFDIHRIFGNNKKSILPNMKRQSYDKGESKVTSYKLQRSKSQLYKLKLTKFTKSLSPKNLTKKSSKK